MIASLGLILLCQLAGEVLVHALALPMPGPVLGLVLLLVLMLLRNRLPALDAGPLAQRQIEGAAKGLLAHLSLLFVPAGVGVVQYLALLREHGVAILFVLAASVVVTLLATVGAFLLASRATARQDGA